MEKEIENYYLKNDNNCAEAVLKILNERYDLGIKEEEAFLLSGFGGGCGCGKLCGALAGCIAALGHEKVSTRAHATEGFREACANLCQSFEDALGSTECKEIRPRYFEEGIRCGKVLEKALECYRAERDV